MCEEEIDDLNESLDMAATNCGPNKAMTSLCVDDLPTDEDLNLIDDRRPIGDGGVRLRRAAAR
jgi:hypothetical protein